VFALQVQRDIIFVSAFHKILWKSIFSNSRTYIFKLSDEILCALGHQLNEKCCIFLYHFFF